MARTTKPSDRANAVGGPAINGPTPETVSVPVVDRMPDDPTKTVPPSEPLGVDRGAKKGYFGTVVDERPNSDYTSPRG